MHITIACAREDYCIPISRAYAIDIICIHIHNFYQVRFSPVEPLSRLSPVHYRGVLIVWIGICLALDPQAPRIPVLILICMFSKSGLGR
jgi:hypothetical protein